MNAFPADVFKGKSYAVVGLGRAGLAALRALTDMGAYVTGWDDAAFTRETAQRDGFTIADPTANIGDYTALLLSPGIPHTLPAPHRIAAAARIAHIPIVTDAELLFQAVRAAGSDAKFAGITGTNGKSTTTSLLAHILTHAGIPNAAGANLGPPALSLPLLPDNGVYVLEMSSYMLERLATLRFDVAAMLNLSPDHLDRHGDMAGYIAAKKNIFARQASHDTVIIGIDDPFSAELALSFNSCVRISGHQQADVWCDHNILKAGDTEIINMRSAVALPGTHNAQNAACAFAMARALGVSRADCATSIASFSGLAHRQEHVLSLGGVRFINDSKATNADAASRALACYSNIIWIAGGIAKQGGIEALAPYFPHIAEAILIGRDAPSLATILAAHNVAYRIAGTLEKAVATAWEIAPLKGSDVILLSPACASFDQFSGFEERGLVFTRLARALPSEVPA